MTYSPTELYLVETMRPRLGSLLAVLLLAPGCRDAVSLMSLRRELVKEFPNDTIGVSLTDGLALTVTFVNDSSAKTPCDSLTAFALRAAAAVRRNYEDFESLQMVSIAFAHRESSGSSRTTSSRLPFRFSRAALESGQLAADSASAQALCELGMDYLPVSIAFTTHDREGWNGSSR